MLGLPASAGAPALAETGGLATSATLLSTCCTIIAFKGSLLLAQEISAKGLEKVVDLDGQQYRKIGRFVNLHPLHH